MSVITLNVNEALRTLSADDQYPFVVKDKTVDIVRFALNTGFTDVVLDENSALRVMYQRPGESQVRGKTLMYYDTDGLHNFYDWHLLAADLAEKGALTVALCILRVADGVVEEWHTTPCQVRVLGSIHTDDSDEGDESITPTAIERIAVLESMVDRLKNVSSGVPKAVSSVSDMTDEDQIYILASSGDWYWYDGSDWVVGGTYGAATPDTTLSISGAPADAGAVGTALAAMSSTIDGAIEDMNDTVDDAIEEMDSAVDEALNNIEDFVGTPVEANEAMKYSLTSKYDDFQLIDGYGYFDAKMLLNGTLDHYVNDPTRRNHVFRMEPTNGKNLLTIPYLMEKQFSPDFFPFEFIDYPGDSLIADLPEGFWVTKDPNPIRTPVYFTIPSSVYGDAQTLGDLMYNMMGSVGIRINTDRLQEYDPSEALADVTGGAISEETIENELFYKGQLNISILTIMGIPHSAENLRRIFSSFGFTDPTTNYTNYAKEYVRFPSGTTQERFLYAVKASRVSSKTVDAIKDYLINDRNLKFYYVAPEEVET